MSGIELLGRRVTVVGINYAPEPTGIGPYTTALAHALVDVGADVHVITGLPHYPQWSVTDPAYAAGNTWREFDGPIRVTRCRHWVPARATLKHRARMESSFFARALKMLRRDRSDLVIAVTPSLGGLAAAVAGARHRPLAAIVQDLTGNAACETGATTSRVVTGLRAVEYGLLRRFAKVGVITPEFGRTLREAGLRDDQIVDLPNFSHIRPINASIARARRHLGWNPDRFTVVHTGNMGAKQGLHAVVDAARLSRDTGASIDFVLIGDGNERVALEEAAIGIPNLRILPLAAAEDYPYVLAAADVVLINELPGVRTMSLPSKLTSYAAAGRPILAAIDRQGISADFLRGVHLGHVVESGSGRILLESACDLRSNPARLAALAQASTRVYGSHFNRVAAYHRYQAFAADILGLADARVHPRILEQRVAQSLSAVAAGR